MMLLLDGDDLGVDGRHNKVNFNAPAVKLFTLYEIL